MIDDEPDLDPDLGVERRPRGQARRMLARLDRTLDRLIRRRGGGGWLGWLRILALALIIGPPLAVFAYRFVPAPETMLMAQRALEGETISHTPVPLEDISPHLVRAVIAGEDAQFCRHNGFDMAAIEAAMKANERAAKRDSGKLRGGSTISQQTAKNLFLWPHRDWVRKGAETYLTALSEWMWPKRKIMEQYLNAIEWGSGRFGAEAAAQAYFGKSAKALNPYEAARLAAVLPSPNKWSVLRPGPYVRARAASIVARMWAVRAQGLDLCVLQPGAAPPPRPAGKPPMALPPLPEPPPSIVVDDAPIAQAGPAPELEATDSSAPVSEEAPEEPPQPADAPAMGKHAPVTVEPTPAPSSQQAAPSSGAPLDLTP